MLGFNNSGWWPSQSWASAAVIIQQIIRVFDDPSCPPHPCIQTARLPASTNGQRSHISLGETEGQERENERKNNSLMMLFLI